MTPRRLVSLRTASAIWTGVIAALVICLLAGWFAGWRAKRVETTSMSPAVPVDSLAVVAPVSPLRIEVGDVIVFSDPAERERRVLHRVVSVVEREGSSRFFETQGDANSTPDAVLVPARDIEGRLRFHVPRLGAVAWALRPPTGLLLLTGLPLTLLLLGEMRARRRARSSTQEPPRKVADGATREGMTIVEAGEVFAGR